jgi:hypothetical protein
VGEGSVLTWSARDGAWARFLDGTFGWTGEPVRLSDEARCPRTAHGADALLVLLGEDPATWQGFTSAGARGEPTSVMFLYPPAIAAFLSDNPDLSVATSLYVLDAAPGQGPVVVWAAHTNDRKHHLGVFGQRYDPTGETLGEPLVLDEAILKWKTVDAVDVHATDRGFAVVWRQKKKIHIKVFASDGSG